MVRSTPILVEAEALRRRDRTYVQGVSSSSFFCCKCVSTCDFHLVVGEVDSYAHTREVISLCRRRSCRDCPIRLLFFVVANVLLLVISISLRERWSLAPVPREEISLRRRRSCRESPVRLFFLPQMCFCLWCPSRCERSGLLHPYRERRSLTPMSVSSCQ